MQYRLSQIADLLKARLEGDPDILIESMARIEEGRPGAISFLANPKYYAAALVTEASALIVGEDFQPDHPIRPSLLRVADPYTAFTQLLALAAAEGAPARSSGIDPQAWVHPSAKVDPTAWIGPFAYIGEGASIGEGAQIFPHVFIGAHAVIGPHTTLHPSSTVYHGCRLGARCMVHSGARIGADGFGFAPQQDGTFLKIPQTGIVTLGDEVEVGANSCIDRATIGATVIHDGVKIDNLVQIAHNVEIGAHTAIAAQTGIAGSTKIGASCMIGGQVAIGGHIQIADRSQFGARSGIIKSIRTPGLAWRGAPAQELKKQLRYEALLRNMESLVKRLEQLETSSPPPSS